MTTIHLTQHLESETLYVPELRPLVGKDVEIIIRELPPGRLADPNRWKLLEELAGKNMIDPAVIEEHRRKDVSTLRTVTP
jgi:hypothetical protein